MAQAQISNKIADDDLKSIEFTVKLQNIINAQINESRYCSVRGQCWCISFIKNQNQKLAVELKLRIYYKSTDWVNVTTISIRLRSTKFNQNVVHETIETFPFNLRIPEKTISLISWNQLIDPKHGYINNDGSCIIDVKIETLDIQDTRCDEFIMLKKIEEFCANCERGQFHLIVNRIGEFDYICSPEFILNSIPFRILIIKRNGKFRIKLFKLKNELCFITMECKLISISSNVFPITVNIEDERFDMEYKSLDIISIDELIERRKYFIENESMTLSFFVEIVKPDEMKRRSRKRAAEDLICRICYQSMFDRPMLATDCGHVFCRECIGKELKTKTNCPKCNQKTDSKKLRAIEL